MSKLLLIDNCVECRHHDIRQTTWPLDNTYEVICCFDEENIRPTQSKGTPDWCPLPDDNIDYKRRCEAAEKAIKEIIEKNPDCDTGFCFGFWRAEVNKSK